MKPKPQIRFGLIGKSLAHSFSPAFFARKFARENLPFVYEAFELEDINALPVLLSRRPELIGLNVTIPYKAAALPYLDELSPEAEAVGAVNTMLIQGGRLSGFNTDIVGCETALRKLLGGRACPPALVLGTGGAAAAVLYTLINRFNCPETLSVSRSPAAGQIGYAEIDQQTLRDFPLVVNTTPLGTFPNSDATPALPYELLNSDNLLFDLVYNPPVTAFLRRGAAYGAPGLNGRTMLEAQAKASWEIWRNAAMG